MKVLLGIGGTDGSVEALDRTVARALEAGDDLTIAIVEDESDDTDDLNARVESVRS